MAEPQMKHFPLTALFLAFLAIALSAGLSSERQLGETFTFTQRQVLDCRQRVLEKHLPSSDADLFCGAIPNFKDFK
jgi:hypothetical protein